MTKQKINFTSEEKTTIIIIAVVLMIGAISLHTKQHQVRDIKVSVTNNGPAEELALAETENRLKEQQKVYINTATLDQLTTIPGIGETLAARIMEYRERHGSFWIETDLLNVKGIGEKKLEKIRPFIKVE